MADNQAKLSTAIDIDSMGENKDDGDGNNNNNSNNNNNNNNNVNKVASPKVDDQTGFETIMTKLITRNYEVILFCVLLLTAIGFIIYLFSGKDYWIWGLAVIGLLLGVFIDFAFFKSENITNYQIKKDSAAQYSESLQWKPYNFTKVLCSSELRHPRLRHISYKNWVLTDDKTLIFHKGALARIEGYHGWEIGASLASFISFIISIICTFGIDTDPGKAAGVIIGYIGIIILATVIGGLLGVLIEKQLRNFNLVHPTDESVEWEVAVPLHEVGHFEYVRLGYSHVYLDSASVMAIERLALLWFRFLVLVIRITLKLIQLIIWSFYVNPFFILLLILTLDLYFLYAAHVEKNATHFIGALIVSWILFVLSFTTIWFFSNHINRGIKEFNIGTYNITKISESRMSSSQIKRFFWNLFSVTIALLIIAGLASRLFDAFYNVKLPKISIGNKNEWFRDLTCKNVEGTKGNNNGGIYDSGADLCKDSNYNAIVTVLIIGTLLWFWLLFSSLFFYFNDQRNKNMLLVDENKNNRKWVQYVGFSIYRNPYIKYPQASFASNNGFINFFLQPIYSLFWTSGVNSRIFPVYIELSPTDADVLAQYLIQNSQLYNDNNNNNNNNNNIRNNNNNNNNGNINTR